MPDKLSEVQRSVNMRSIRSEDTAPELFVRSLVHSAGYRFRLHVTELPGKPDIVLPRLKKIIFVHGCFWHLHRGCNEGRIPASRRDYWRPKLSRNVERDRIHARALRRLGWRVLTVWECQLRRPDSLRERIIRFLES